MRGGLAILVLCGVANAQPAPEPQPQPVPPATEAPPPPTPAEVAFQEGRELLEAGQFVSACAKFETSIKLDPSAPGTLLNLGLCNLRVGRTATALMWFRKAQFRAAETGMTDYEETAKDHAFSLSVRVPTVRITFDRPLPPGATVYLDNVQVAEVDLAKVEVDPKAHVVELRIEGRPPVHTEFVLKDGDTKEITIPVPQASTPSAASTAVTSTATIELDHGKTQRIVAYALAGAGVLMWGGSLTVSLIAKERRDASERPEDWEYYRSLARWGGTSLFIGGTLAIAGASVLYFSAPDVERVERTAITPVVGTDQLGVAVHGAF